MPLRIFKHEQTNLCAADQACVFERCKADRGAKAKNPTIRTNQKMNTKKSDDIISLIGLLFILAMIAAFACKLNEKFPLN
jgi:hypothetical protein